jgi:16S rRNA (cytidine1402-2'-O)-methyltransferase
MPTLYLIPNRISEDNSISLPSSVISAIKNLRLFFVEEPKSARSLLKQIDPEFPLRDSQFLDLNEHSKPNDIKEYSRLLNAQDAAIISESGCPCVADPGADLVLLAHGQNMDIVPLVGPSSILLALMASGLNGQSFAFNGYLPKDAGQAEAKLRLLEKRARDEGQSQIFMDTPYRNQSLFDQVLKVCSPNLYLCIALDLTGTEQWIKTKSIGEWKKTPPQLPKKPALFIINKLN